MSYEHIIEGCLARTDNDSRPSAKVVDAHLGTLAAELGRLDEARRSGALPMLSLADEGDDLAAIGAVAARYRDSFDTVLVFGTGGSSLGGQTLLALAAPGAGPRVRFVDTIDPLTFGPLLEGIDPARTGVVAISKSGGTLDTLAQVHSCLAHYKDVLGDQACADHFTVITQPGDSHLRRLADKYGIPILDHHPDLGGRFSVLSVVGALPALIGGLDMAAVRQGAAQILDAALDADHPGDSAPALGAGINKALCDLGFQTNVVMHYSDRLAPLAAWHRQLWAESLGKGGVGSLPAPARMPADQHSLLQLYLDGPNDKFFTVISVEDAGEGRTFSADFSADLAGRSLGDLMTALRQSTVETLVNAGRPVREIRLARLDETSLGALVMHFMLETLLAAKLFQVDPFGQPAVEAGKALARRYLAAQTEAP